MLLAVGHHFGPWDSEIIKWLSLGESVLPPQVVKREVYGENSTPWDIFTDEDPWFADEDDYNSKKQFLCVYTKVTHVSDMKTGSSSSSKTTGNKKGRNVSRKAGRGSWSGQDKSKEITLRDGTVIGEKKMFTYEVRGDDQHTAEEQHGRWNMYEYTLSGIFDKTDFVICKIIKDQPLFLRKLKKRKLPYRVQDHATNKKMMITTISRPGESIPNAGSVGFNSRVFPATILDTNLVQPPICNQYENGEENRFDNCLIQNVQASANHATLFIPNAESGFNASVSYDVMPETTQQEDLLKNIEAETWESTVERIDFNFVQPPICYHQYENREEDRFERVQEDLLKNIEDAEMENRFGTQNGLPSENKATDGIDQFDPITVGFFDGLPFDNEARVNTNDEEQQGFWSVDNLKEHATTMMPSTTVPSENYPSYYNAIGSSNVEEQQTDYTEEVYSGLDDLLDIDMSIFEEGPEFMNVHSITDQTNHMVATTSRGLSPVQSPPLMDTSTPSCSNTLHHHHHDTDRNTNVDEEQQGLWSTDNLKALDQLPPPLCNGLPPLSYEWFYDSLYMLS